ncbi:histidine phosphatase superfamily [Leucosporidium creatinivorum]|uniref:Histidine phosphatase superfamily n=1 Tax=Leucosporidium creatinivorum TaxID=106004 RepID=A0A1Y2EPG7_9BASI|nr:histidine phosphatase superfamily [Leucosporidium creatinivorum]
MKLPTMLTQLLLSSSSSSPAEPSRTMDELQQRPVMGKVFTPTNYTVVRGFFLQDEPSFNSTTFDLLHSSFGLLSNSTSRWHSFRSSIDLLNSQANKHTTYKVLYVARHGEGWHNRAEEKYGTEEWNRRWSRLEGDGEMVWGPDPLLTPLGEQQARAVNEAWKEEIKDGVPLPMSLYSSPLSRSARTLEITWEDILIEPRGVRPLVREHLRETIGLHTCDKRSPKSVFAERFPSYKFEVPFSEHDQLWSPNFQESSIQQALRTQQVLNHLFATDPSPYISLTAHGGTIASLFRVVGHQPQEVKPGGFVPIVLKAVDYKSAESELLGGGASREAGPVPTALVGRRGEL